MEHKIHKIILDVFKNDVYFKNILQDFRVSLSLCGIDEYDITVYINKLHIQYKQRVRFQREIDFSSVLLEQVAVEVGKNILYELYKRFNSQPITSLNILEADNNYLIEKYFDSFFHYSKKPSYLDLIYFMGFPKILSNDQNFLLKILKDLFYNSKDLLKNIGVFYFGQNSRIDEQLLKVVPRNFLFNLSDPNISLELRGRNFDLIIFYSFSDYLDFKANHPYPFCSTFNQSPIIFLGS